MYLLRDRIADRTEGSKTLRERLFFREFQMVPTERSKRCEAWERNAPRINVKNFQPEFSDVQRRKLPQVRSRHPP